MLVDIAKGFMQTGKHMARYLAGKGSVNLEYPEVKREQPPFFRGRHRLQRFEDGLERCVGCALCAAVCPSEAIYLEAQENTPEHRVSHGERYAEIYQIHLLRCIYCGFCEEACPENAIIMGPTYELAMEKRTDMVANKEDMLDSPEKGFGTAHEYDPYISHITEESDRDAATDPWTPRTSPEPGEKPARAQEAMQD